MQTVRYPSYVDVAMQTYWAEEFFVSFFSSLEPQFAVQAA